MGIKQLNKVLSENKNIISKNNNEIYFKEALASVTRGEGRLCKFVYHIDTSLIVYKHLFGGNDMESVYTTIKNGVLDIKKKKNKVIFYSEPWRNKRKSYTQQQRKQAHDQTQTKVITSIDIIIKKHMHAKKPIPEKIIKQEVSTVYEDIREENKLNTQLGIDTPELDTKFISLLEYDKDCPKKKYETYLSELEYFSNNDIYKKQPSSSSAHEVESSFFDFGEECDEDKSDNATETINHSYNVIKDRKQLFTGFLMNNPMTHHKRYITDRLIEDKVISKKDIIGSEFLDAELNIIKNIKEIYSKYNNIIISTDQDCLLFGLYHIDKGVFFMKEKLSSDPQDISIVLNTRLSKNISLITSFFNESDYFKGLEKTSVTPKRMKTFLIEYSEIMSETFELRDLIAIYTKWFVKHIKQINDKGGAKQSCDVDKYFDSFSSFLKLEESFFTKDDINKGLTINELDNYFINVNPRIPYINILSIRVNELYTYEHF